MASYQNQNQNEDHILIQPSHAEPYSFSYIINNNNHEALELHIAQQRDQIINCINQTVYLYDAFTSPKGDIILSLDQILSRRNRENCETNLRGSENRAFSHQVMKVLTWNARGAGRAEFEAEMKQHVFEHKPHVLIIVGTEAVIDETRIDQEPFEGLAALARLGFDRRIVLGAEDEAGSGGIWFFWDSNHVEPASMLTSPEFIRMKMVLINNYLPQSPP